MKKLKVGIIGAGGLAGVHIDSYKNNPNVIITALCDSNQERVRQKAAELGINEIYSNYEEILNSKNVDAVSVITWNNTHAPIAIAALKAGKHVLCEKPPSMSAAEAVMMREASKQSGKLLMYGFVRRFAQNTIVLKEYIEKGKLGEIYYAKTGYLRRCGNPGGWFAKKEISGGGPLIDLGIHIIDLSMYLMGKPKPVSVFGNISCKLGNRAHVKGISWYKAADYDAGINTVEDFADAIIKFENGASLFFETSWTMHIKADSFYMDVFGDKGGAKLEPELEVYCEKDNYMVDVKPVLSNCSFDAREAFSAEINHFVDCILNNTPCICPAEDGVTIMQILDAVYESAEKGEMVKINRSIFDT
ncbi:MAG: Gfo/Idh/MocA family oxidoreductase [Ruminiclostridium sp.]|nr:Gfo/Idh/MocA family oxidoreductase [Ruminiclostridium sp.]